MCHNYGQNYLSFKIKYSLTFQTTWIRDCFKFSILDFDMCLNGPTITNSEKFLFLNGISIVVVINCWLKQYVINLTKLV